MKDRFQVLSLDGGGIRGAFAAGFFARIEEVQQRRRDRAWAIHECVDLFAGTSTGGIIAASLALGVPASRIEEFYKTRGPDIFTERRGAVPVVLRPIEMLLWLFGMRAELRWVFGSKYTESGLEAALDEVFTGPDGKLLTLGDSKQRLLLPAVDLMRGQTVVFKTPHLPSMVRDRDLAVRDVIRATTAAPTYFPVHKIDGVGEFCDGGVWANNPAMVAIVEVLRIADAVSLDREKPLLIDDVHLLAVGTGTQQFAREVRPGSDGLLGWGPSLLDVVGTTQSQGTDFQAGFLLGQRFRRVNFTLPESGVKWRLDALHCVEKAVTLGRQAANESLASAGSAFWEHEAPAYRPLP